MHVHLKYDNICTLYRTLLGFQPMVRPSLIPQTWHFWIFSPCPLLCAVFRDFSQYTSSTTMICGAGCTNGGMMNLKVNMCMCNIYIYIIHRINTHTHTYIYIILLGIHLRVEVSDSIGTKSGPPRFFFLQVYIIRTPKKNSTVQNRGLQGSVCVKF